MNASRIVLFDGICNFCNNSILFVIDRDPAGLFRFAALQSPLGEKLRAKFGLLKEKFDSILLIENDKVYTKSTAALRIARELPAPWSILSLFILLPATIRDFGYDFIARNRYSWFGKEETCRIPTPELRSRFLEEDTD